jgi:transposase
MRGDTAKQASMLSILTPDQLVPQGHPIRLIKPIVERALQALSSTFDSMYADGGRLSIPPEHLLKGCLLMALYTVRSERQFCERLQYDLLFKWFLDLNIGDPAFDHTTFSKNRQRLLEHAAASRFFQEVVAEARRLRLLSGEHFTVDGTLLQSWASIKSLRPREGSGEPPEGTKNPSVDFRGERRRNETHASTTDPEARLARRGPGWEARLAFAGHVLMENRNGLVVDVMLTQATGTAEREAALEMLEHLPGQHRITVGADKAYDAASFVEVCRAMRVTPHVARRQSSSLDGRTTRHVGYTLSQRVRKRVEEVFGWIKTVAGGRKLRYLGVAKNQLWMELTAAAYNLVRISRLLLTEPMAPAPA